MKINKTPTMTSRNFIINDVEIADSEFINDIHEFSNENVIIKYDTSKIKILDESNLNNIEEKMEYKLTYGLGEFLENQAKQNANKKLKIIADNKTKKDLNINFKFDNENRELVDNIEVIAKENSNINIIIKYDSGNSCMSCCRDEKCKMNNNSIEEINDNNEKNDLKYYHNGIIRVIAEKQAKVNVTIVNLLNEQTNNFITFDNLLDDDANLKYTIIDFGGKRSIQNYYSNLIGNNANNILNAIYLGKDNQLFDINYISHLNGKNSNIDIDVQGVLKDKAKKNFKGTIDFKKGCKKSVGSENEYCMLLSNEAKSISLPILLCSEEDVEGNHSSSSGKADKRELFYIMSRGLDEKEAMKLLVKANFNKIIENITDDDLKNQVLNEIDKRLD